MGKTRLVKVGTRDTSQTLTFPRIWGSGGTTQEVTTGRFKALRVSTVFGCIRILSENVATLPLDQFIRRDGVKRPYRPRARWLDFRSGPLNKIDFLVQVMTSQLTAGNAYVATPRLPNGDIQHVTVLDPAAVKPTRKTSGIERTYRVNGVNGTHELSRFDILHIPGMTLPGDLCGVSPIEYARQTIDLADAATTFGGAFFKNAARPSVVMETPDEVDDNVVALMRDQWSTMHEGAGNVGKLAIATAGATIKQMSINPDEAQYLETRKFQVPDIARIFGVPAHLLAHADSPQFGTSIAEQNVAFVQHSLRPWVERIEQALTDAEHLSGSPFETFVGLNVSGLMRGDYKSRIASNVQAVREGIITINEARQMEDLPPVEWGDEPISVQVQENAGNPAESDGQ